MIQVKQGFCWPAFVFGTLWALTTRVYPLFFIMMAVEFALWLITGYAAAQGSQWLELLGLTGTLAYTFIRGMRGNRWVQSFLLSRGYVRHGSDAGA